jgi:hypothetical protein
MKNLIHLRFKFPEGCAEKYSDVVVSALPRPGDIVSSHQPNSGKYRVSQVAFLVLDFLKNEGPFSVAIEVSLEPLDDTLHVPGT